MSVRYCPKIGCHQPYYPGQTCHGYSYASGLLTRPETHEERERREEAREEREEERRERRAEREEEEEEEERESVLDELFED